MHLSNMDRILLASIFSLLCAFGVHKYLDSKIPRATATVQLHHPHTYQRPGAGTMITGPASVHLAFPTDVLFDSCHSDKYLSATAQKTDFNAEQVNRLEPLKKITSIEPVRGTDFATVTVKHKSSTTAALLANAITEAMCEYSLQLHQTRNRRMADNLDQELARQTELVESSRHDPKSHLQAVERLREIRAEQKETRAAINDQSFRPITIHKAAK